MTHEDGLPRLSARSVGRADGPHRQRPSSYPTGRGGDPYGSLSPLLGISSALFQPEQGRQFGERLDLHVGPGR